MANNDVNHEVIARLRNCVLALADQKLPLYDTSILYAYDASAGHPVMLTSLVDCMTEDVMIM